MEATPSLLSDSLWHFPPKHIDECKLCPNIKRHTTTLIIGDLPYTMVNHLAIRCQMCGINGKTHSASTNWLKINKILYIEPLSILLHSSNMRLDKNNTEGEADLLLVIKLALFIKHLAEAQIKAHLHEYSN